ncbi:MAG: fibronectin type III domain-containing protein, partial [Chloroflexi bacterium]
MALLMSGLLAAVLVPATAVAAGAIALSSFVGTENPLSENGLWAPITSLSPNGGRFQKNNGAFPTLLAPDHAGARTTAAVPADHYSEIVVGHVGPTVPALTTYNNVGPVVRVQTAGASLDSHYLWWAAQPNGVNGLYRIDATGTTYQPNLLMQTSSVVDGDRLRLIARGNVIYGIKNGVVRDFIYNTGANATRLGGGSTGMLAYTNTNVSDAVIASWSTGAAPTSSGTVASSTFAGVEDPLDEGDRWYPLPGYQGFRKAGGVAVGRESGHNASGVWSISPPAKQYSEVTLGTVTSGGGGPMVRIDRTSAVQTGWLLFLSLDNPATSGIYKTNPNGSFTGVRLFTPTILPGDKWRLSADGNVLEVLQNGVSQFTYTTDGSYASGDVGIEAFGMSFGFVAWEGGATPGSADTTPPTAPSNASATATSSSQINVTWNASTDNVGVTGYLVERCQGANCATFTQVGSVAASPYNDTGLSPGTSYSYRVRATDAAGNLSPYSNLASATTQPPPSDTQPPTAPSNASATATSSSQINVTWNASTDNVGVTGYLVERCQGANCATFTQVGSVAASPYNDTGLSPGTSYSYRVRATDAAGNLSPYSNLASATTQPPPSDTQPPTAPSNASATATSSSQINLTWTASTDNVGVTGYQVERCAGATCTTFAQVASVAASPYNDTGLSPSTSYTYRVRATDAAGNLSPYSNVASATTPAAPPPSSGLVAAYAFGEGSGTTTADASGKSHTGTLQGGATWTTTGKYGSALSFNGTTSYVDLGNAADLQLTGSMTWSAWIFASANPPDDGQIIAKSGGAGWQFKTSPDTGQHT